MPVVDSRQKSAGELKREKDIRESTIRDSREMFRKRTRGLHKTHPSYIEEERRHKDCVEAVLRRYPRQ